MEVAHKSECISTHSPTDAMHDIYEGHRDQLSAFRDAVALHDGQLGTLVAIAGKPVVVDHVSRPDVFAALHAPLVQGYALDALEVAVEVDPPLVSDEEVQAFLDSVLGSRLSESDATASAARSASPTNASAESVLSPAPSSSSSRPSPRTSTTGQTSAPCCTSASTARRGAGPPDVWLITTRGFFSVVAHHDLPEMVLVRARLREDTLERDYDFRAVAPRERWSAGLVLLAAEIDYGNFKNAVTERQGHKRADIYHRVWFALAELQQ